MVKEMARPTLRQGSAPDSAFAFFEGKIVPIGEAKVSVMTHALNYGTACFEGIRAYWNEEENQLFALFLKEHYVRILNSCKILRIALPHTAAELSEITLEVLRKCNYRQDAYVRPLAYKPDPVIGVRLHNLGAEITIFAIPYGTYVDIDHGLNCSVSSWRRTDDNAIPARGKITGAYVNTALAKSESEDGGYDEAIVLTADGHVSEGSAENLFMVRDGVLVTPPASDNILEGITRAAVMKIAEDEGIKVAVRSIDRTELYICEELFLTGTGAQISPVVSVDKRLVGDGTFGPVTTKLKDIYYAAVKGKVPRYRSWCTPVYK